MKLNGKCYCGQLHYEMNAALLMKGQCHCRECQYISGGAPQLFMAIPAAGFQYTAGTPKVYRCNDIDNAVTREFCEKCGTHLITRRSDNGLIILKIGTLNDPADFDQPKIAIYTKDKQSFHHIPDGMPAFYEIPEG